MSNAFVVERQPPQMLKTNTKFAARVRLLVGAELSLKQAPPQVDVSIINEMQAEAIQKNEGSSLNSKSGELLNTSAQMEWDGANKRLVASFRMLQLKKIKRSEKKEGSEAVTDEKFAILFRSSFQVGGLQFNIWTTSLPVVVVVHGNQETHAMATIYWDNAFSETNRVPFQVPHSVPWPALAEMLTGLFADTCGRGISEEGVGYLQAKLFGSAAPESAPCTWKHFCKETLPTRTFTFWEWFYAALKLTRTHFRRIWRDGLIMGFVTRDKAISMLADKSPGTFLLRFSDSEVGGVVITCRSTSDVFHVAISFKELLQRTLADRIIDEGHFKTLYPSEDKYRCFSHYCKTEPLDTISSDGYLRQGLVSTIKGIPGSQLHNEDSASGTRDCSFEYPNVYSTASSSGTSHSQDDGLEANMVLDNEFGLMDEDMDISAILDFS